MDRQTRTLDGHPSEAEHPPGPQESPARQTLALVRRPVEFLEECRARYGETFTVRTLRLGELVFISDPASIRELFAADRTNTVARVGNLAPVLGSSSVVLMEGEEHLLRRRLMLPPFHGERMMAYGETIRAATERELATWPMGESFPLYPSMQAITLEVMLRAVFGVEDEQRHDQLQGELVKVLAVSQSPATAREPTGDVSLAGTYREMNRLVGEADSIIAEQIAERRADPDLEHREDILSMLVQARFEDGSAMEDSELRDQLMTLLMAGHETTATSLAWAFDLLFRNPQAMAGLEREITAEDKEQRYLGAVINEVVRLRPVIPFIGRRLHQGMNLGGYPLREGTKVMAAIQLVHTRPDLYEDPYSFQPERFLGARPTTFGWIPFGGGTRRCLGAAFAELEMRVLLTTVLSRVRLQGATGGPEEMARRHFTVAPLEGTPAIAWQR